MKRIFLAVAAVALIGAPALAQPANQDRPPREEPRQSGPNPKQPPRGQYGEWNDSWGKAPPPPPRHFTNSRDWHRHVHACQQRYRSYNPATDTFRTYAGKKVRCRL